MIIKCHECGTNISSEAKRCPSCGYPLKNIAKKNKHDNGSNHALWKDIVGVSVSGAGIFILCPTLMFLGIAKSDKLLTISSAIGFILLLFPFVISLISLSKRKS